MSDKELQNIGKWFIYELKNEYKSEPKIIDTVLRLTPSFDIKNTVGEGNYEGIGVKVHGYITGKTKETLT